MRIPLAFILIFIAITQVGFTCGPGITPPGVHCEDGAGPADRSIQIGQYVDRTFAPLSEDQTYPLDFGPQGGQHIFVAVRFFAEGGEDEWLHEFSLLDEGGLQVGSRFVAQPTCEGWTVVDNLQVFVDDPDLSSATIELDSGPIDLNGERIRTFSTSGQIRMR